jgi:hypothetical protein
MNFQTVDGNFLRRLRVSRADYLDLKVNRFAYRSMRIA